MSAANGMSKTKKQRNIRTRIMGGIVIIMLLTILIPISAYYLLPEWAYYLVPGTRLWLASEEICGAYGAADFLETLKSTEQDADSTVELFTADGRFVYSSRALVESLPKRLDDAETVDGAYRKDYVSVYGSVREEGKGFQILESDQHNRKVTFLNCYQHFPDGGRVEVCMQVSQLLTNAKVDLVVSFVVIMTLLIVGLVVFSAYIQRMTEPIRKMCGITDRMARLDFSEKCPPTKLSEITDLSLSINQMSDALDTALTDLKGKNEQLQKDIENERTIDSLRKTFISGISHELKTPIAIIQGYAEGAKTFYAAGKPETADSYCDIVVEESQRMNAMILKLLEITKYSSGDYEPNSEPFSLRELTEDWLSRSAAQLEEKGISWTNDVPERMGFGDKLILSSVVNNYLSNAMSHADGEKRIRVYCRETPEAYRVVVFNTGRHIEEKDIDKIWTSFYRADKSLSRSQGRFGLGLAIVAAIQKLHGMAYGVENVEDGVEFWFDVQKAAEDPPKEKTVV